MWEWARHETPAWSHVSVSLPAVLAQYFNPKISDPADKKAQLCVFFLGQKFRNSIPKISLKLLTRIKLTRSNSFWLKLTRRKSARVINNIAVWDGAPISRVMSLRFCSVNMLLKFYGLGHNLSYERLSKYNFTGLNWSNNPISWAEMCNLKLKNILLVRLFQEQSH